MCLRPELTFTTKQLGLGSESELDSNSCFCVFSNCLEIIPCDNFFHF